MKTMDRQTERAIAALAADHRSSASEILQRALALLRDALRQGGGAEVAAVGRGLCLAQPCMASIWNAVGMALTGSEPEAALARFETRVARAPGALARFAVQVLPIGLGDGDRDPMRVVTCSSSRSVLVCLQALGERRPVRVACAEGRPAFEGRDMAKALADPALTVDFFTDAGLGAALHGAELVVVGADAVASSWVINKSGTHQLAAAASGVGVPVYVVASRDKLVGPSLAGLLTLRSGPADEVWDGAPSSVFVRNPYFEKIPMELVTSVITDVGVLGPAMVSEACDAASREVDAATLAALISSSIDR